MFPTLTRTRCDCCDQILVDEAGLMLVCDAIRLYHRALERKAAEQVSLVNAIQDAHAGARAQTA